MTFACTIGSLATLFGTLAAACRHARLRANAAGGVFAAAFLTFALWNGPAKNCRSEPIGTPPSPPVAAPRAGGPSADWLLHPAPYRAEVVRSDDGREVTLTNGLVRRVLRLAPNAATVAFDDLTTHESLLRSIRPEAMVEIDGVSYAVGGLEGQPVHNYLDPRWINGMASDPAAFRFTSLRIGKTVERFPWKKRLEWMPSDLPWPPPGVSLTLSFAAPAISKAGGVPLRDLAVDEFQNLSPAWKLSLSKRHERTSFRNEGKAGEIMAYENTHAYAEQPWREGAVAVQACIDPGTDRSASWGPGLAVVFPNNDIVKIHLRSGRGAFGMSVNGSDKEFGRAKEGTAYHLRLRLSQGKVVGEVSPDGKTWEILDRVAMQGTPRAVRVGKMDRRGDHGDFTENGKLERCRVTNFRFLSEDLAKLGPAPPITVDVHYELYDGIPVLGKWITVKNGSNRPIRLNRFTAEIMAVVETESIVDASTRWESRKLFVETDYTFGGMSPSNHGAGVHWVPDPFYATQVNYERKTPCLLECRPPQGPDQILPAGGEFTSFRVFEMPFDSTDRERRGLAMRRFYRTLAPWVTENPILMHVRSADPTSVRRAVDQCADVGFEMVILTFGSGFNFESRDPKYQRQIKELADYARSKKIAIGGYSLLASRGAATAADNTQGEPARFGVMPCLGATWGAEYLAQLKSFIETAGLEVLEHDGSYPGDRCAAVNHPHHRGLDDSQWVMWKAITDLYQFCRARGVYLNIPDWYFLNGATKTGMGYRETNWSLPREYQEIIERQNIFDGTWEKTPSMGWMFVPLTEYHGGGRAATIEPLKDHLPHYEQRLANLFGAGVQACYRGPRLYDAPETREVVKKWVDFYKKHRAILDGDLIHLRRADGRDLDYVLHVRPASQEKGLLMIYNPLEREVRRDLSIPLYYTGLKGSAKVRQGDGEAKTVSLDAAARLTLPVVVPPRGVAWYVFE